MVADFGIARALTSGATTQTGISMGTPQYMSPEQATNAAAVDARTDVYGLGCVLYEMLAGEPPFTGPTAEAILARMLTETPRPLGSTRTTVSPTLEAICQKAMARVPADRFATASEFAAALAGVAGETRPPHQIATAETLAIPSAATNTTRWPSRRLPVAVAAGVAVLLAAAAFGWWRFGPAHGSETRRLAVLPFENLGAAEDAYFAEGITDEVRGKLTALRGFAGHRPLQRGAVQEREREDSPADRPGAWGRVPADRHGAVGTRAGRDPPCSSKSRTDRRIHWNKPLAAAIRWGRERRVPDAGGHCRAGGRGAERRTRRRCSNEPRREADDQRGGLRRVPARRGTVAAPRGQGFSAPSPRDGLLQPGGDARSHVPAGLGAAESYRLLCAPTYRMSRTWRSANVQPSARRLSLPTNPRPGSRWARTFASSKRNSPRPSSSSRWAFRRQPNNVELLTAATTVERSLGRFEDALAHAQHAARLDPRSIGAGSVLARTYRDLRRFKEADAESDRTLALAPRNTAVIQGRATNCLSQGDLACARNVITKALADVTVKDLIVRFATTQEMMWVLPDDLRNQVLKLQPEDFDNDRGMWALKVGATDLLMNDVAQARSVRPDLGDRVWKNRQAASGRCAEPGAVRTGARARRRQQGGNRSG